MLQMGSMNDLGLDFARKSPDAARSLFNLVGMNKPAYSGSQSDGQSYLDSLWNTRNPWTEKNAGASVKPPSFIREEGIFKPMASMSWLENVLAADEGEGPGAGLMTYAPVGSGENQRYISYPLMSQDKKTGQSVRFSDYHQALGNAMGSGEYIPFQTAGEADWFSKHYRKMWGR